jgi:hypothetical protein
VGYGRDDGNGQFGRTQIRLASAGVDRQPYHLKNVVNANSDKFPREYTDALQHFINSWDAFLKNVSGKNVAWWDLPGQIQANYYVKYYGPEIHNQVQRFVVQYKKLWDIATAKLGRSATPTPPPVPSKPVSENPVADTAASLVRGVLIITGCIVGGYALVNWLGKPKRREVIAAPAGEVVVVEE